jgi:hypothetical protein
MSGAAFAVWHLQPSALRYYALMGVMLGVLYVRRGLACSLAAHFTFNGLLAAAAMAVVLSPGTLVTAGHVSMRLPGGWATEHEADSMLAVRGPSGASLVVAALPAEAAPDSAAIERRVRAGVFANAFPGLEIDSTTTRRVALPVGTAVEVDLRADGHDGTLVLLPLDHRAVDVVFLNGGSSRAESDFDRIMKSLRVG